MKNCKCDIIKILHGESGQNYVNEHMNKIAVNDDTWEILYHCLNSNRYWKKYFPNPEEHGGGLPDFIQITEEEAKKEFNF